MERDVEKATGTTLPPVPPADAQPATETPKVNLFSALKFLWSPVMRRRTAVIWTVWFVITFSYYGFFSWIPTLLFAVLAWVPERRALKRVHSSHPAEYPVGGEKTVEVADGRTLGVLNILDAEGTYDDDAVMVAESLAPLAVSALLDLEKENR